MSLIVHSQIFSAQNMALVYRTELRRARRSFRVHDRALASTTELSDVGSVVRSLLVGRRTQAIAPHQFTINSRRHAAQRTIHGAAPQLPRAGRGSLRQPEAVRGILRRTPYSSHQSMSATFSPFHVVADCRRRGCSASLSRGAAAGPFLLWARHLSRKGTNGDKSIRRTYRRGQFPAAAATVAEGLMVLCVSAVPHTPQPTMPCR